MPPKVVNGTLIFRQWAHTGLLETSKSFTSLDELYAHCLEAADPEIVDRIVIQGLDADGHPRVLTFVFQSITVSPLR
jgi:hypothetical protein